MSFTESEIFKHLQALVSFDTQNPPKDISADSDIFHYFKKNLEGFNFKFIDAGEGSLSLLAIRGEPSLLFNFHIDTVPVTDGWESDPFDLIQQDNKLVGLGACDIKGAAACMLSAVTKAEGDVALLFSSDEEHGASEAVKKFLTTDHGFKQVIISEPTKAKAVTAHRGIQTALISFSGISGHASETRGLKDNAIHKAGQWISKATQWASEQSASVQNLTGVPFNIGTIDGGIKPNMIAPKCEMKFGFRPLPGQDSKVVLQALAELSDHGDDIRMTAGFFGPSLPATNQSFEQAIDAAKQLANDLNIEIGDAVSFWTEASLFSQAGMTAFVFGPGDIAQAHTANEWVEISQLEKVEQSYIKILNN